ncbi:MAG: NAD(P)H-dependent oxidoreductase [Bacteroidota bacterium]
MSKILAFGASNSKNSLNKQFAHYVAGQIEGANTTLLDLKDFDMQLYCIDTQNEEGFPAKAEAFHQLLEEHDGFIISLAEHNQNYTATFKNIIDWVSRIDRKMWKGKPVLLLSTSPGGRGGRNVMDIALKNMSIMGANIIDSFCLPSFYENFHPEKGITNEELAQEFQPKLDAFIQALVEPQLEQN